MPVDLQELFNKAGARELAADDELVVVALHEPSWDKDKMRGTRSTFQSPNKSVSRLKILPLDQIINIFKSQIGGGRIKINGYGKIGVKSIKEIGMAGVSKVEFEVTIDPVAGNSAHAEIIPYNEGKKAIKGKLPDGLCTRLIDATEHYVLPD